MAVRRGLFDDDFAGLFESPNNRKIKRAAYPSRNNRRRLKRTIFRRDNFTCQERSCGRVFVPPKGYDGSQPIDGLTLGHVIPRARGGAYTIDNLRAECYDCNHKRGNQVWE